MARHAVVYCADRSVVGGLLVEVGKEDITLLRTQQEERIPFSSISKIIVVVEGTSGHGATYGAFLGSYLSGYLIVRSDQPSLSETTSPLFIIVSLLPGLLIGGGLGYLLDSGSDAKEVIFDLAGSRKDRASSLEQLRRLLSNESSAQKIHISVSGAYVPRINSLTIPPGSPQGVVYLSNSTDTKFRFLRRADVTYSLVPEVSVGVAFVWFGDLPTNRDNWQDLPSGYRTYQVTQTSQCLGKFVIARFDPLPESLNRTIVVDIGGGVGLSSVDVTQNWIWSASNSTSYTSGTVGRQVSDSFMSGVVFAQVGLKIHNGLSIGFSFDRVIAPSRTLPAQASIGLPEQNFQFSSTSIGFTLGLHF